MRTRAYRLAPRALQPVAVFLPEAGPLVPWPTGMAPRRQVVWASVAAALLLAVGSATGEGGFRRYWRLQADVHGLEARNAKVADDNARLRRELDALRSDRATLERAVREELGYVRPGEIVFDVEAP